VQEWSVSLCSLSIRLDSEVLTHPEIPIPMGTCPRKAGAGSSTPPGFQTPRPCPPTHPPRPSPLVPTALARPALPRRSSLARSLARSLPASPYPLPPEWPAINSAVSRYAQFSRCIKIHGLQSAPADHNATRRQRLRRTSSFGTARLSPPSPLPLPPPPRLLSRRPGVSSCCGSPPWNFFGVHFISRLARDAARWNGSD